MPQTPFWTSTELAEMTSAQWESLCDGCAKCCLNKLADQETGQVHFTWVACRLLDTDKCKCTRYDARAELVPTCLRLRPDNLDEADLPRSCAYRRLAEGKGLPQWHPLVTGNSDSTHRSGNSVLGRAISELQAGDIEQHLIGIDPW